MKPDRSTTLVWTARALALDAVCGEVVSAWRARGVNSILLKGSTIASWLYPDEVRPYSDVDLLIEPDRLLDATEVLQRLGFVAHTEHEAVHSHPWTRSSDGVTVDLHVTLWGALRPPSQVWNELQHWIEHEPRAGTPVAALSLPAKALYVVIHAAQHADLPKPREDLRRALRITPERAWLESVELADRLWALEPMARGLALDPVGQLLARRHPLVRAAELRSRSDAPFAITLTRISSVSGVRKKLALVGQLLARHRSGQDTSRFALARGIVSTVRALRRARRQQ